MPSSSGSTSALDQMWNTGSVESNDAGIGTLTKSNITNTLVTEPMYGDVGTISEPDFSNLFKNSDLANSSFLEPAISPMMIPVITKTLTEWESPSISTVMSPQKLQSQVQTLTTQQAVQTGRMRIRSA